jgi:hypothetical protein
LLREELFRGSPARDVMPELGRLYRASLPEA